MNIAVRVDATSQIGTGHFMRCLTLADALRKSDARIRFVSRGLPDYLSDMLAARCIEFVSLDTSNAEEGAGDLAHSSWLGVSQAQDAENTAEALANRQWDWLIVDHYALDARWENAMRGIAGKIMVIDDLADRKHDCDVLLDQNYYLDMHERYQDLVPEKCRMFVGPNYALLREEFVEMREHIKPRIGRVRRILVFFGGIDAGNFTRLAIEALKGAGLGDIAVDVVIGGQHPCRAEIEATCVAVGYACHVQTSRIAELMAAADFAIGAGGSATWERCCMGLPTFTLCTAENQRRQIADAAKVGLLYAPSGAGDFVNLIRHHTKSLLDNAALLHLFSSISMKITDGLGAMRIVGLIGAGNLEIRCTDKSDSQKLFEWRNHPSIRTVSKNTQLIEWDAHCLWFDSVMSDKDRTLLIGRVDDKPVGVVRFDSEGDAAEVSIYLVPDGGFPGQGRALLLSAERWLMTNRTGIREVRAEVLNENMASQRLFIGAGYQIVKTSYRKELKG